MNDATQETVEKDDPWKKLLYIALFLVINSVLKGIVLVTAAVQFIHVVVKHDTNPFIADFSQGLSNYSYDIVRYVTYLSDDKPFPFSEWKNDAP